MKYIILLYSYRNKKMSELRNRTFTTFDDARNAIEEFCRCHYHPVKVYSKEKVASYNRRVKEESRIHNLTPDSIYACWYVLQVIL